MVGRGRAVCHDVAMGNDMATGMGNMAPMSWSIRIGLCLIVLGILVPSVGFLVISSRASEQVTGTEMVTTATPMLATLATGIGLVVCGVLLALIDWMRH